MTGRPPGRALAEPLPDTARRAVPAFGQVSFLAWSRRTASAAERSAASLSFTRAAVLRSIFGERGMTSSARGASSSGLPSPLASDSNVTGDSSPGTSDKPATAATRPGRRPAGNYVIGADLLVRICQTSGAASRSEAACRSW